MSAYASLDALRRTLALGGDEDTTHDTLLAEMLDEVSSFLDGRAGRTFDRSDAGTVATFDVHEASSSLAFATGGLGSAEGRALDLVAVTKLEVRDSETASYAEVAAGATGYYLQAGVGPGIAGEGWPYEDVVLSPASSYPCFPTGLRAVRITGTFGFPVVPDPVRRAVVAEVRERFRQGVSGGAAPQGVNQFGTPVYQMGSTDEFRDMLRWPYVRTAYVR